MSAKNDDLSRRGAPRNGVGLSEAARANVASLVAALTAQINDAADALRDLRHLKGSRAWRRECLTVAQRTAIRKATRRLRKQAEKWVR